MGGKIPGEGVIWKDFIRRASREPNIYPQRVIKKPTKKQLRKLVLAQSRRRTQRFWTIRWCDYVINQKINEILKKKQEGEGGDSSDRDEEVHECLLSGKNVLIEEFVDTPCYFDCPTKDLGDSTIHKMSQLDNADEEGEIDF